MNLEAEPYFSQATSAVTQVKLRAPKVPLKPREQPGRANKKQRVGETATETTADGTGGSSEATPSSGIKGG